MREELQKTEVEAEKNLPGTPCDDEGKKVKRMRGQVEYKQV